MNKLEIHISTARFSFCKYILLRKDLIIFNANNNFSAFSILESNSLDSSCNIDASNSNGFFNGTIKRDLITLNIYTRISK